MTPIEQINREHRDLELRIDRLWALLHAPAHILPRGKWRRLLRSESAQLRSETEAHFFNEERGGYFAELLAARPHLARQAGMLEAEHATIRSELVEAAELAAGDASIEVIKARLRALVTALSRHEERENELVQSGMMTDLGGG